MERVVWHEVGSKKYPLAFTLRAARKCIERFGDIEKVFDTIKSMDPLDQLDAICWMLSVLIDGGIAYVKLSDPDKGAELSLISPDQLFDVMTISDSNSIVRKLSEVMNIGMYQHILLQEEKKTMPSPQA